MAAESKQTVELVCAMYGSGAVASFKISRGAKVSHLKKAIYSHQRFARKYDFAESDLTLRLARKQDQWLANDESLEQHLRRPVGEDYEEMYSTLKLGEFFEAGFKPGSREIQVLVELPKHHTVKGVKLWHQSVLDAFALTFFTQYEFKVASGAPAIDDVFNAVKTGHWESRQAEDGQPVTNVPLDGSLTEEGWGHLRAFSEATNDDDAHKYLQNMLKHWLALIPVNAEVPSQ